MNWRRGLLRLYAVATVIWFGLVAWSALHRDCFNDPFDINPETQRICSGLTFDYEALIWAFAPPLAVLALAFAIAWIAAGFKSKWGTPAD